MANGIQTVRIEHDVPERIATWLFQTLAFAAAIIFGTWTILGWQEARVANQQSSQANLQSSQANLLALAAFCSQQSSDDASQKVLAQVCANSNLQASISSIAVSLLGSVSPTPTATSTTAGTGSPTPTPTGGTPPPSGPADQGGTAAGLSVGAIVGIVIGATTAVSALVACAQVCFRQQRRYH